MKTKIIIIGLGNIGKRYLQAASGFSGLGSIACYDKRKNFQSAVNDFCRQNSINISRIEFISDLKEVPRVITKKTIIIISTTAEGRCEIIKNVINQIPLAIICEKPLCQNIREYETIMMLARKTAVPIYLNFSRHLYSVHKKIYGLLRKSKDKTFSAFFPGGMACGGIHILELATWLLNARSSRILYSRKGKVFKSKRPGFWDFSGEIAFCINEQNLCFLKAAQGGSISSIRISCENNEFNIFEFAKKMLVLDSRKASVQISDIEIPLSSQVMVKAIHAICHRNNVELPTIFQSYLAHKILFECMQMNKLEKLNIT